jgi:tRNA 2-selenouridine synthase
MMNFSNTGKIEIKQFLELAENIPVIDVRSPGEFMEGHIPGAHNIPLFSDEERKAVGYKYSREGRLSAILEGLRLSENSMHLKLGKAMKISSGGRLLVHCWRGGMRSEVMAWLFSLGKIETGILNGGYKSYRRFIHECLAETRKMIMLGGLTGSGKTGILRVLSNSGKQVADLEGIANHRGSAFGSIGESPQPSGEQFANLLFNVLRKTDMNEPLWVEDESRNIGTVFMPEEFYLNMQNSPAIILMMDSEVRIRRLAREYRDYPADKVEVSILKISRRMGGDRAKAAITALRTGDLEKAIAIVLEYYDKAYMYGLKKRSSGNLLYVRTDTDDVETNAVKICEASASFIQA